MIHPVIELCMETPGAFHLVKISGISRSAVNGTRLVGSSHSKIPRKSGKSLKVSPFSRLEFPNGISCSIYTFLVVCTSSRSTVGHRNVPGFTTKWNNFLPIGNSTFAATKISRFFPKWKAPAIFMPMRMRTPSGTAGNQEKHPLLSFATKA